MINEIVYNLEQSSITNIGLSLISAIFISLFTCFLLSKIFSMKKENDLNFMIISLTTIYIFSFSFISINKIGIEDEYIVQEDTCLKILNNIKTKRHL